MPAVTLLGPPEIYTLKSNPNPNPTTITTAETTTTTNNVFVDQMVDNFNSLASNRNPLMGFTENMSPTFLSTGNPCLDFFFHVVPDTPSETLVERLKLAWSHNPLTTLKLVCNLRGVRGTGKSNKEGFYAAALWLHENHPKTLATNVSSFAAFGYFKDLPEILYRLLEGFEVREKQKEEWQRKFSSTSRREINKKQLHHNKNKDVKDNKGEEVAARAKAQKETAHALKEEKRIALAKKLVDRYNRDPDFKFLHNCISHHFADCLKKDLEFLKSGSPRKISLAAKWCPSLYSSFDRSTLLCETIAKRIFPREEYEGVEEAHYAYRVRDRLRKDVLVPLRKALQLPEVFIGANQWGLIPYNRVASVAMEFYKEKFLKHDEERFEKYLQDVKAGKTTMAAGALLPHKIIKSFLNGYGGEVDELQWKRIVDDLLKKGKMKNCLAVSDVSASMYGTPMEVSVALGLLVSELSEEPWKGKVISFSAEPELHVIKGDDLKSKARFVRYMDWGFNTDFQKVFDRILDVAVNGNLKEDQMIKRIFVFSDMEFDRASAKSWETGYQVITRKFREKGYGSVLPQIVFWNLRDSIATPVPSTQKGVALLSGFSKNLLTLFLDNEGDLSPEEAMEATIAGPEYQKLVVLD
ncbi:plant/T31B5-30 protein [Medicago truncatula]|nr:plant/T31B5-30 protein [Medicago truncatula]